MKHLDTTLLPSERAEALLSLMTVREKAQQLVGVPPHLLGSEESYRKHLELSPGHISGVNVMVGSPEKLAASNNAIQKHLVEQTRLGIPAIIHAETLNGLVGKGFTSFPTPIGLAATWSPELVEEMSTLIGRQARAVGVTQSLSPVLDVARDARWGRVHETFGEEVLLTSAMGVSFIRGLQGEDRSRGVLATAKHFIGYAMTEGGQNLAATHFGPRELFDVYATPFAAAIDVAGLASVMNSYSEIDGVAVGASKAILTDLLRGRLGFEGTVVSDYRTTFYLVERMRVARDAEEAAALALEAGLDVELPEPYAYGQVLADAVVAGNIPDTLLDQSVLRVLTQKFELGLFEAPFVDEEPLQLATSLPSEGRDLSAKLAERSLTLLKNDLQILPLSDVPQRIAVLGPHATDPAVGFANYSYPAQLEMMHGLATGEARLAGIEGILEAMSPAARRAAEERMAKMREIDLGAIARDEYGAVGLAEAIAEVAPEATVIAESVAGFRSGEDGDLEAAVRAAKSSDVVILALGGRSGAFAGRMTEGEGTDTANIDLPVAQQELIRRVHELGKPVVAVLFIGRPYGLVELEKSAAGMLVAYYPGPEGTRAVAKALFGQLSPSGKLPFSLPRHSGQVPIYQSAKRGSGYRREARDNFQNYADMLSSPLFPFGHGLGYATIDVSELKTESHSVRTTGSIAVEIQVTNSGSVPGAEVVQLYAGQQVPAMTRPMQQLVGFARIELEPGERAIVTFEVEAAQLAFTGVSGQFAVVPGPVELAVGLSSSDIRERTSIELIGDSIDAADARVYFPQVSVRRSRQLIANIS